MFDRYAASKLGVMNQKAFTDTAARVQIIPPVLGRPTLFMVRANQHCHVLQGGSAVAVTTTTGAYVVKNMYFPILVEGPNDSYLSIIRDATNGTLDVVCIDNVGSWTMPDA